MLNLLSCNETFRPTVKTQMLLFRRYISRENILEGCGGGRRAGAGGGAGAGALGV